MADIRIKDLPLATGGTAPTGTDAIAIDGLTTRKTTISALGDVAVPVASQAEAEAGSNASKRMTPLTTKQSIASEVGDTIASAAQGALADSAVQPEDLGTAAYANTGDFATFTQGAKADSALQQASNLSDVADKGAAQNNMQASVSFVSIAEASTATIPARNKQLNTKFFAPNFTLAKTQVGGGAYKRIALSALSDYPALSYFRSIDRFMPDGTTDNTNGGYWVLDEVEPNVFQFGALGDNSTNDNPAFTAAASYCRAASKTKLKIPNASYVHANAWTLLYPVDIDMEPSANIRFTNESSAGIVFDFRGATANYGLCSIRLGGVYSPSIASDFTFPGYPSAWSASSRSAQHAIILRGGSRINIEVQYCVGWNAAFRPAGTFDVTYGAKGPENINFTCNTVDLCTYGVYFNGGPATAKALSAIVVRFNTCFAKFPVYYDANLHSIAQCNAFVDGQAFTNEDGGALVYGLGSNISTCTVEIAWGYAGYGSDSPTGTLTTLTLPYLAGSQPSNGLTNDGGTTLGYFGGGSNKFSFGIAVDQAGNPGGAVPTGGVCTRIRDTGPNNNCVVEFYTTSPGVIALSQTQGEANYNGGVGGASLSKKTLVSVTVPTMGNLSAQTFYFYNQLLSDGIQKPIKITPLGSSIGNSKLFFAVRDDALNVNRQAILEVTNLTGGSVTGATYFFWLEV